MKKILLLLIAGTLIQTNIFAQSLELMKADGSAIVNDTIYISTTNTSLDIDVPLLVKNISEKSKDVMVKLYVKQIVDGSSVLYCWNSCFDIETTVSSAFLTVNGGDTIKEFHSTLNPNGYTGVTEIMYTFFVNKESSDSASVTITCDILTTGIDNFSILKESISSYPNPANNFINFNYDLTNHSAGEIIIYDITGKKVKHQIIDNSENYSKIDVSELYTGIYIWTIKIDGLPVKTEKFIKK